MELPSDRKLESEYYPKSNKFYQRFSSPQVQENNNQNTIINNINRINSDINIKFISTPSESIQNSHKKVKSSNLASSIYSSLFTRTELLLAPLESLLNLCLNSYGPNGAITCFQNNSFNIELTSISSVLFQYITDNSDQRENIVVKLFSQLLNWHNNANITAMVNFDCGYYTLIITIKLIQYVLINSNNNPHTVNSILHEYQSINSMIVKFLTSNAIYSNIDDLQMLLLLTKSILSSKPMVNQLTNAINNNGNQKALDCIAILIVELFLNLLPNQESAHSNLSLINIHNSVRYFHIYSESVDQSKLMNGILMDIPIDRYFPSSNQTTSKFSEYTSDLRVFTNRTCLVYNISLNFELPTANFNEKVSIRTVQDYESIDNVELVISNEQKRMMLGLCNQWKQLNINTIFCQKIIHPVIKQYCIKNGILYMECCSNRYITSISDLTNSQMCSSIQPNTIQLVNIGKLTTIQEISLNNRLYTQLLNENNNKKNIYTILLYAQNKHQLKELELLMNSMLSTLTVTILNRDKQRNQLLLSPGAGSTELKLAHYIRQNNNNSNKLSEISTNKNNTNNNTATSSSNRLQALYQKKLQRATQFTNDLTNYFAEIFETIGHKLSGLSLFEAKTALESYIQSHNPSNNQFIGWNCNNLSSPTIIAEVNTQNQASSSSINNSILSENCIVDSTFMKIRSIERAIEIAGLISRVDSVIKDTK